MYIRSECYADYMLKAHSHNVDGNNNKIQHQEVDSGSTKHIQHQWIWLGQIAFEPSFAKTKRNNKNKCRRERKAEERKNRRTNNKRKDGSFLKCVSIWSRTSSLVRWVVTTHRQRDHKALWIQYQKQFTLNIIACLFFLLSLPLLRGHPLLRWTFEHRKSPSFASHTTPLALIPQNIVFPH